MTSLKDIRLAIFGPGLLGGSLLHDARALGAADLRVWARRKESLTDVHEAGLADFSSIDPMAVAEGADVLVLCVPVGGMKELAAQLAAARPATGAIFTDVGSVKGMVMREVAPVFTAAGHVFIGSHPMAGGERTGLAHAKAGLYRHAPCLLTPGPDTDSAALKRLHNYWHAHGCRVHEMDAATHDAVVARISHLPHAAAVLATLAALRNDSSISRYSAGGLRDTTRVASGDPAMWREIMLENREALLPALRDFRDAAATLLAILENNDAASLEALLAEARDLRSTRYP